MVGSTAVTDAMKLEEDEEEQVAMVSGTQPLKKGDSKFCLVCGDKALGYNFNAITCESCKAFFRRNALKTKEFRCPFEGSCKVDTVTRRFCQRCRLKKCFDVGMRKEWIMSDEEKVKKKQKIQANRVRRMIDNGLATPASSGLDSAQPSPSPSVATSPVMVKGENSVVAAPQIYYSQHQQPVLVQETSLGSPPSSVPPMVVENQWSVPVDPHSRKRRYLSGTNGDSTSNGGCCDTLVGGYYGSPAVAGSSDAGSLMTALLSPADGDRHQCGGGAGGSSFDFPGPSTDNYPSSPKRMAFSKNANYEQLDHGPNGNSSGECSLHAGLPDQRRCRPIVDPLETVNSVMSVAIRAEFSAASLIGYNYQQTELNDPERAKIYELVVANEAMLSPIDVDASHKHCVKDPNLINVINMTDLAIRRIIKMMKRVKGFKNLCQEDQIALLKGGCTELLILRSVTTYDPEVNSWKIPHTSTPSMVKLDVLKKAGRNVYEEHQRFIRSFTPLWRNDENIMLILGAITLFSPERPHVIHRDVVKLEQDSYYYLLKRYLESILPGCEAKSQYLQLIHRVQELHYLNENHVRVYLDINPREVEPLLIEIFDLMRHQPHQQQQS